jgi:hypothetical protein
MQDFAPPQSIRIGLEVGFQLAVELLVDLDDGGQGLALGMLELSVSITLRFGCEVDTADGASYVAIHILFVIVFALSVWEHALAAIALPRIP